MNYKKVYKRILKLFTEPFINKKGGKFYKWQDNSGARLE